MPALPLRPRSATELVDAAFQIMRAHYPQFILCSAIAYLPLLLVQLLLVSDPVRLVARPELGMLFYVGAMLDYAIMSSVLVVCASQAYLGDPVDVGAAVRKALPRMPLVIVGAFVRYVGVIVGLLALFVGAFYVMARWFAVTPLLVLERRGLGQAFSRSSALSRGRKLHIIATFVLTWLIYLVLTVGVQLVVMFLVKNLIVQAVAGALLTILAYPVIAITEALLYFDARIKHEGFDIEMMAGALASDAAGAPAAR
jgi:Membrane domain of glycerophosphoryl diester phosphodiesterase